jgi:hypothetical protein
MIQVGRKQMLCVICLAAILAQVALAQAENLPYVAHDYRQASTDIVGISVAVNFQDSVSYGSFEDGICKIGLTAQKRKQNEEVATQNAIEEVSVKQDSTDNPVVVQNSTDKASVKQDSTYNPVVVQNSTDKVSVKQDSTYNPVAVQNSTDKASVKQDSTYNPVVVQKSTDKVSVKQDSTYNPVVVQNSTDKISVKQDSTYNPVNTINNAVAKKKAIIEIYPEKVIDEVSQEDTNKMFDDINNFDDLML